MSKHSRNNLGFVILGVVLGGFVVSGFVVLGVVLGGDSGDSDGVSIVSVVLGVLGAVLSIILSDLGVSAHRQALRSPVGFRATAPPLAARSLGWVRRLLPGNEGALWWAEVISCLAETADPRERRRYVRSYRRKVPQLIWTSWTVHLSASRQRELL
jgi:hypothetical protein